MLEEQISRRRVASGATRAPGGLPLRLRVSFSTALVFIALFVMLALPKGGLKIDDIPITWSYVSVALLATWALLVYALQPARFLPGIVISAPILAFPIMYLVLMYANGIYSLGFTISAVVSFLILPLSFLAFIRPLFHEVGAGVLFSAIKWSVRFAVFYGVFIYIFNIITGSYFEVPYVTVNIADVGELANKYNDRGTFNKFFSTYNNGNIYGVCMYMLLPIYSYVEKRRWIYFLFIGTIILTSSRSAYLGLAVALFLTALSRGVSLATLMQWALGGVLFLIGISVFLKVFGLTDEWLFDSNLSGRRAGLEALSQVGFFSDRPAGIWAEMNYVASLSYTGYLGLLLFCVHIWTPLVWRAPSDPSKRLPAHLLKSGLAAYAVGGFFDGAALLIPVMGIFWFLASCLSLYSFSPRGGGAPTMGLNHRSL